MQKSYIEFYEHFMSHLEFKNVSPSPNHNSNLKALYSVRFTNLQSKTQYRVVKKKQWFPLSATFTCHYLSSLSFSRALSFLSQWYSCANMYAFV